MRYGLPLVTQLVIDRTSRPMWDCSKDFALLTHYLRPSGTGQGTVKYIVNTDPASQAHALVGREEKYTQNRD